VKLRDIEIILREMAEQVAIRLRRSGKKTTLVSIYVGFSKQEVRSSIHTQMKVEPTNNTAVLTDYVLKLFHDKYTSGAVRSVGVNYSGFVDESFGLISLFDDVDKLEKEERLHTLMAKSIKAAVEKGYIKDDKSTTPLHLSHDEKAK